MISARRNTAAPITPPRLKGYMPSKLEVEGIIREGGIYGVFVGVPGNCNLGCPFCYAGANRGGNAEGLTLDEWKHVIDVAKKHGAGSIVIAGEGEPLMDEKFFDILDYVHGKGMTLVVFTNGTLMTPEIAKGATVIAKLNSWKPEVQDEMVGVPDAHKRMYRGLNYLLDAGFGDPERGGEGRIGVDSAITWKNIKDLYDVFRFCRNHGIVPYFEALIEQGRALALKNPEEWQVTREALREFFENLREIDRELGFEPPAIEKGMHVFGCGKCQRYRVMVAVGPDGKVTSCVSSRDLELGNIREKEFDEILKNPQLKEIMGMLECPSKSCTKLD